MYYINLLGVPLKVYFTHYKWGKQPTAVVNEALIDALSHSNIERPPNFSSFTVCDLFQQINNKWECVAKGISFCSEDDNFCRKDGRDLSFNRAMIDFFHVQELSLLHFLNQGEHACGVSFYDPFRDMADITFKKEANNVVSGN